MQDSVKHAARLLRIAGVALLAYALWSVVAPAKPIGASVRDFVEAGWPMALLLFVPERVLHRTVSGIIRAGTCVSARFRGLTLADPHDEDGLAARKYG